MADERKILTDFKSRLDKSGMRLKYQKHAMKLLQQSFNTNRKKSKKLDITIFPEAMHIIDTMVEVSGLSKNDFMISVKYSNAPAKHLCWYLLSETGYSQSAIARHFNRHYSSVMNAIKKVKDHIEVNDQIICDLLEKYKQHEHRKVSRKEYRSADKVTE